MSAPRGRPPNGYEFVDGAWAHIETGQPFDAVAHAQQARTKKRMHEKELLEVRWART